MAISALYRMRERMARETMNDLAAFLAVAREQSFTRAAASLDVSTSAVSHAMRRLEKQVGVRLLSRNSPLFNPPVLSNER